MSQQRRASISEGQQTVIQARLLTQMNFQHVAVSSVIPSRHHLQQIQLRLFFQQQQHPCRRQPRSSRLQELQRWHGTAHPQCQHPPTAGMVQLHRPDVSATATIKGVAKGLLELGFTESRDPLRQGHAVEGIAETIQPQAQHSRLYSGLIRPRRRGAQGQIGQRCETFQIREPPGFLTAGGQPETLEGLPPPLLHRRQHAACHGQATP